jgi:hypothetical protein
MEPAALSNIFTVFLLKLKSPERVAQKNSNYNLKQIEFRQASLWQFQYKLRFSKDNGPQIYTFISNAL